jgi:hypothetical protein
MIPQNSFLDQLKTAADKATADEEEFRRSITQRIKALEQERAFAFRRLNFIRAIAEVVSVAESQEIAVASANAILRTKLGWSDDSEPRSEVMLHFVPVVKAMFANLSPPEDEAPERDVPAALLEFETWYGQTHKVPFWILFENYMPETPVVDF